MSHDVLKLPKYLSLGNRGDFGHTVAFDVTDWEALGPDTYAITYIRPGETSVYPVDAADIATATANGVTTLTWTVSAAVTDIEGTGSVVLSCAVGSTLLAHSDELQTIIGEGHTAAGTPPEPLADYISKWSAADIAVTEHEPGTPAEAAVSQDSIGTHFSFAIPTDMTKWASLDISLSYLALGADPTASITQDESGTHIAIGVPAGPSMVVNPDTGELEATV